MIPFIDMHCDTLTVSNMFYQHDLHHLRAGQLNIERLIQGGARVQFFAICLPKLTTTQLFGWLYEGDWKHIRRLSGILYHTCKLHPDQLSVYVDSNDLNRDAGDGKIRAVLTIEDGRDIRGDMRRLSLYHRLGVRLITLTWNFPNCFGFPNSPYGRVPTEQDMSKGLTPFGKDAIEEMNRLGMIVDVSHLSDGGFWDVAEISKKPFVASHSNCRSVCDHRRNLTDEQIRTIAEHGGVIGLNQYPAFLRQHAKDSKPEDNLAHLSHMRDVGGIDCIALGADFDGCGRSCKMCVNGPQDYPQMADFLLNNGFTQDEVEKIYYKNVERVLKECT